jgi:negative regulator of sigma E activity
VVELIVVDVEIMLVIEEVIAVVAAAVLVVVVVVSSCSSSNKTSSTQEIGLNSSLAIPFKSRKSRIRHHHRFKRK